MIASILAGIVGVVLAVAIFIVDTDREQLAAQVRGQRQRIRDLERRVEQLQQRVAR